MSISNDILHEYLQVSRHIADRFRVIYGKLNLTYPQSIVLAILECDGPMPISALAEAAGSANSTISGVVDRLEKLNLVQRTRSDSDRRVIYVSTTEQFRRQFAEARDSANNQFSIVLNDLSEEDAQAILKGLRLLRRELTRE